jgi:Lon protease-like protein
VSIDIATPGEVQGVAIGRGLPEGLPVLPLKESVAYPNTLTPLAIGQERSIKLINDVLAGERMLVMAASKDPELETPGPADLYRVGVAGTVARMIKVPDGTLRILVQGGQRVRLVDFLATDPYLVARIEEEPDVVEHTTELEALTRNVQNTFSQIIEQVPYLPEELKVAVANLDDPAELSYMIAGALRIKTGERQELLEERNLAKRLRRLLELLTRESELISLGSRIQSQIQSEMDTAQREYFLRQQLKAIQEELGESDDQAGRAGRPSRGRAQAGGARADALRADASSGRRARRDPHLSRVDRRATVAGLDGRSHRPSSGAQGPRSRPLRHRDDQGPHPRVPGGAQAEARRPLLDPVLRRPAGCGQDLARQVDRLGDGPQLRAHLGRRRPRRE